MKNERINKLLEIKRIDKISYAASAILPVSIICLLYFLK